MSSIAYKHGLFWDTIWSHPKNSSLKTLRKEPNILFPGDKVFIPDIQNKNESAATEQRHTFRRNGLPEHLRIRVINEELTVESIDTEQQDALNATTFTAKSGIPYQVEIDGALTEGITDSDGYVDCSISPVAKSGRIILEPGTENEWQIPIQFGYVNPDTEISGIKQRLNSLGFECGDENDAQTPEFVDALKLFQTKNGLDVTGELDKNTKDKLMELYGH